MLNFDDDKCFDENDFSSIVATSLRNVIENSVTDLVLPYRILSLSHISSWKTFQNDLIQRLKQNLNIQQINNNQDFVLINEFDRYTSHLKDKQQNEDIYFESLMNCHFDLIEIKSDFDRLRQFI